MHIFGIDISKASAFVAHYEDETFVKELDLFYDSKNLLQFYTYLKCFEDKLLIFEATGVYSTIIRQFCINHNIKHICINPLEAHFKMKSLRRYKTDKVDAHKLAHLGFTLDEKYIIHHTSDEDIERKSYTRLIMRIEDDLTKLKTRLKERLSQVFPSLQDLVKHNYNIPNLRLINLFAHPQFVLNLTKQQLKKLIKQHNNCQKTHLENLTIKLVEWAQNTYITVHEEHPLVEEIKDITEDLIRLIGRKKNYVAKLKKLCADQKLYHVLLSINGVGEQNAALLTGELGNIDRFETNKQLNAFVGIDIVRYESGTIYKKDHINRRGSSVARKILYQMVELFIMNQHRQQNHICDYYYKLKEPPYNKHHKVAMIACVNKLIKVMHYLNTTNSKYDYQRATRHLKANSIKPS